MSDLSEDEKTVIKSLIRAGLRKNARNRRSARQQFGRQYDPSRHDAKQSILESAYRKLGGDPARISNLEQ